MPIVSRDECNSFASWNGKVSDQMICGGYRQDNKSTCNQDSGGPYVREKFLIGIVSWGNEVCGQPSKFGVYTRVAIYSKWIDDCIANVENNGICVSR